jgi:hypothetical protein
MYTLALLVISSGGVFLLEWLKSKGAEFQGIDPTILPIYDFPDIWQNTTYLGSFLKILLAFIVIISVNNDLTYNTLRQNIIDGISKNEFLLSKFSLIIFLAGLSSIGILVFGLITGSIYSHVWGTEYIFDEMEFLVAHFFEIVVFCMMAFMLSLWIKKSGFVIVLLMLYTLMFEPIATVVLENAPFFRDTIAPEIAQFFPIKALNSLIQVPYPRYVFVEIVDYVPLKAILISAGWLIIFTSLIIFTLKNRDLKA